MNDTPNTLIDTTAAVFNADGSVIFRDETSKVEWYEIHGKLIHFKRYLSGWVKKSREFAADRWGIDFVAESEVQMELDLGLVHHQKPEQLNGPDKTKAIVTIEGISQSFSLWQRKMSAEVETWDREKLTRALDLLEPIERQAKRVRELIASSGG